MIKFVPISFLVISMILTYIFRNFAKIHFMRVGGLIIFIIGILIVIIGLFTLYSNKTTFIPGQKPTKLIKIGLFKFLRNPIYLGDLMIVLGFSLYFETLVGVALVAIFFIVLNNYVIPYEERLLEEVFKDDYKAYKNKVKRWGI